MVMCEEVYFSPVSDVDKLPLTAGHQRNCGSVVSALQCLSTQISSFWGFRAQYPITGLRPWTYTVRLWSVRLPVLLGPLFPYIWSRP